MLSELTALRELNLAFNYFTGVNLKPETVECAFPLLEGLDLGFNYIGSERDVSVVVLFERLQRIVLYGNPLAGPTGEDSLGLCVENLIAESDRYYSYRLLYYIDGGSVRNWGMIGGVNEAIDSRGTCGNQAMFVA